MEGKVRHALSHPVEPWWHALVALVAASLVNYALPGWLRFGPQYLEPLVIAVLVVPSIIGVRNEKPQVVRFFGYVTSSVLSIFLIYSVVAMVSTLPSHKESAARLLVAAAILWFSNVLVFAIWYWRLDGGGPTARALVSGDKVPGHPHSAFLFPQMQMDPVLLAATGYSTWEPGFVDYLFLAFNTSTALSPADTGALSRWAKVMMMMQSLISLMIIALLAARAINIL